MNSTEKKTAPRPLAEKAAMSTIARSRRKANSTDDFADRKQWDRILRNIDSYLAARAANSPR